MFGIGCDHRTSDLTNAFDLLTVQAIPVVFDEPCAGGRQAKQVDGFKLFDKS
jgi:hypothetical protein